MEVKTPVCVVGCGRSGTTIIHRTLCEHPNAAWLSSICEWNPETGKWNRLLMQAVDYPFVGQYLRRAFAPWEDYPFWGHHYKGFTAPCRDLVGADVTTKTAQGLRRVLGEMLTAKRSRLLFKITGWPRVGFLHELFPDCKFIHIVRDGRAVANSRMAMPWWDGWEGPRSWKRGPLGVAHMREWEEHGRSFLALAGIEWKICLDAMEEARRCLTQDNFLEVRYEDFCDQPLLVIRAIADFCELAPTSVIEAKLKTYAVRSMNDKWQEELTAEQQRVLLSVTRSHLKKYGYLSEERRSFLPKQGREPGGVDETDSHGEGGEPSNDSKIAASRLDGWPA